MLKTIDYNQISWHYIAKPTQKDLDFLKENFGFHPLDLEDVVSPRQRPKIESYENYVFLIFHFPILNEAGKIEIIEIDSFIGKNYFVTIAEQNYKILEELFENAEADAEIKKNLFQNDASLLFYNALNKCMEHIMPTIKKLGFEIDNIDKNIINKENDYEAIDKISLMRRNLIVLHTIIKPSLTILNDMSQGKVKFFGEKMSVYWDNIADYFHKISDNIEDYREFLEGLALAHDSLLTHKTNDIIKVLTIFSVILLPLNLIAGIYGMNIILPIQKHPFAIIVIACVMLLIGATMISYFKFKKWIG